MLKEVIEETKYYTCKSDDAIETPGNYKEGDVMKVTDTKEEFLFKNGKWIENFATINKNGTIRIGTEPIVLLKSNMARNKVTIQNNGMYSVKIKVLNMVSEEDFDYILKPSTMEDYGDGGEFKSDTIKMQISVMSVRGESKLSVIEEVIM